MLQSMQQPTPTFGTSGAGSPLPAWEAKSSSASPDFSSLLAALTKSEEKILPEWNEESLTDDAATLSYERALRAHARYRPSEPDRRPSEAAPVTATQTRKLATQLTTGKSADVDRSPKSASITLRMSQAECAQLRERAAEAGLTVSAYLRSCAFEVESLRAQVKEALAQMRPVPAAEKGTARPLSQSSWLRRLLNR